MPTSIIRELLENLEFDLVLLRSVFAANFLYVLIVIFLLLFRAFRFLTDELGFGLLHHIG